MHTSTKQAAKIAIIIAIVGTLYTIVGCTYNRTIVLQQHPIKTAADSIGGQNLDYKESVELKNPYR